MMQFIFLESPHFTIEISALVKSELSITEFEKFASESLELRKEVPNRDVIQQTIFRTNSNPFTPLNALLADQRATDCHKKSTDTAA